MYLQLDRLDLDCQDEYSVVNLACNLLTIVTGTPPGQCRVMLSRDGLESACWTGIAFDHGAQKDFIMQRGGAELTSGEVSLLQTAWATHQVLWNRSRSKGRLTRALTSFSSAWRANYVDQMIPHLGTALATLFGPGGQGNPTPRKRRRALDDGLDGRALEPLVRLMQLRTVLLDGEDPGEDDMTDVVGEAFPLIAGIFKSILTTPVLAELADEGGLLGAGLLGGSQCSSLPRSGSREHRMPVGIAACLER